MESALIPIATQAATTIGKAAVNRLSKAINGKKRQRKAKKGRKRPNPRRPQRKQPPRRTAPRKVQEVVAPSAAGFRFSGGTFRKSVKRVSGSERLVITGNDFAGGVSTVASKYNVIYNLPLNPYAIPGSRLAIEASLYQKFRFHRVKLHYVPLVGTSRSGALLFSHVADPEAVVGTAGTLALAQSLTGVPGAVTTPVWANADHIWAPDKSDKREFYNSPDVDNEARFTVQSEIKVLQMADDSTPGPVGNLYLEYTIDLYDPIVSQGNIATYTAVPVIDTGSQPSNVLYATNGGFGGTISFATATTFSPTGWTPSSLFGFYTNFNYGYLEAFRMYYTKAPATNPGTFYAFPTPQSGSLQDTNEKIGGSYNPTPVPANGTFYFSFAQTVPGAGLKKSELTNENDAEFQEKFACLSLELMTIKNLLEGYGIKPMGFQKLSPTTGSNGLK